MKLMGAFLLCIVLMLAREQNITSIVPSHGRKKAESWRLYTATECIAEPSAICTEAQWRDAPNIVAQRVEIKLSLQLAGAKVADES